MISFLYVPFPADKDYASWCRSLVSRKLAASINVLPAKSFFFWEDQLKQEDEVILVVKTSKDKAPALKNVVEQEHPYRVPAIIEIPVADVNASYLRWVEESTT
ncbi:MAG: divalent-cation tolerance protein CutA [Candidatus Caldarchaeum sp.]|nr:divalent-cation tolerance protein CutA [Candidatus Caldarchaeum sp.]